MYDLSVAGIGEADVATGRILRVNQKFSEITGYSESELLDKRFNELVHPDDQKRDWELFERAANGGSEGFVNEKRFVRKDGEVRWVIANASFVRDENGEAIRALGLAIDVNDLHQARDTIIENSNLLRQITENIGDALWLLESDRLVYVSPAFERIWGRSPAFIYKDVTAVFDTIVIEDRPKMMNVLARLQQGEHIEETSYYPS
jgi:PAS domain S-box-containing protein